MSDTTDLPTRVITTITEHTPRLGTLIQTDVASYPQPYIPPTIRLPTIRQENRETYVLRPVTEDPPSGEYGLSPSGNNWVIPTNTCIIEYDGEPDFLMPDWLKLAFPDGFSAGQACAKAYAPFENLWDIPSRTRVESDATDLAIERWKRLFRPLDLQMTPEEVEDYQRVHEAQLKRYEREFIQGYLQGFSRGIRLVQHNDPGTPGSSWS